MYPKISVQHVINKKLLIFYSHTKSLTDVYFTFMAHLSTKFSSETLDPNLDFIKFTFRKVDSCNQVVPNTPKIFLMLESMSVFKISLKLNIIKNPQSHCHISSADSPYVAGGSCVGQSRTTGQGGEAHSPSAAGFGPRGPLPP